MKIKLDFFSRFLRQCWLLMRLREANVAMLIEYINYVHDFVPRTRVVECRKTLHVFCGLWNMIPAITRKAKHTNFEHEHQEIWFLSFMQDDLVIGSFRIQFVSEPSSSARCTLSVEFLC